MYPSRFRYEAPRSLDEAIAVLRDGGDYAKVLAGGQSLVPMMKLRFASPELLVDINNIPGAWFADLVYIVSGEVATKFAYTGQALAEKVNMGLGGAGGTQVGSGTGAKSLKQGMRGRPTGETLRVEYL